MLQPAASGQLQYLSPLTNQCSTDEKIARKETSWLMRSSKQVLP